MTDMTVLYETDGPVATLTLNRPEVYNAFNQQMRADLSEALARIEGDDSVRICILKGAGRGFSAGNDLNDFMYDPVSDLIVGEFLPLLDAIHNSDTLFIAQIHGSCAGIAAAIAMTCDFVTMADDSAFYMAFAALAIVPDGGNTFHLMQAMGYHRALERIVEGGRIAAAESVDLGMANRTCAPDRLEEETRAWAQALAAGAPLANAAAKRLLRGMTGRSFRDTVIAEASEQNALVRTRDFDRGLTGFREKHRPVFQGD